MIKITTNGIYFNGTNKEFKEFLKTIMWADITLDRLLKIRMKKFIM